jgi:hypothetical protein
VQKWEYLFIEYQWHKERARPRIINDQEVQDWKNTPTRSQHINLLGEEGWELVGLAGPNGHLLIFKRPKQ